ncbi:unnamed protein product [Prunus armeniaca]|uniref:GOST seven transmembrane domain-containing protein n=1 Tax=Prunus armeniaca TaxID=36596 RepID=A0A6J5XWH6_PRUAR|nr:unnamed protein product [Prunus armeniaca]
MEQRLLWCEKSSLLGFIFGVIFIICNECIIQCNASIHEYRNEAFSPQSNAFFFHGGSEGLYASKVHGSADSSSTDNHHLKGKSFIRFESVTFVRTKESANKQSEMQQNTGLVEAIILEVKDRVRIGASFVQSEKICCTRNLSNSGYCTVGEVVIHKNPDNPDWPVRIKTFFNGKDEEARMDTKSININSSGMYYLYFMFCDPQLKGTLIKGRTDWRNPDGYLPGKMAPLMTLYGFMSLAYLVLGLAWFLRFVQFWKDIIQLHYHITAVIALGMCEMAVWYFEYANFNSTGIRPMGITLWAVTFSAVKKTLSRLLLLVVSMGFGVVKPTLGGITPKVGLIRRNMAKLELYRKFTNYLAIFVLLSVAWIGFELYFNATDPLSEYWQIAWIIPAFWTLLAYALLAVICILWAPSRNPTRYAYLEEAGDDFDEEGILLTSGALKVSGDVTAMREYDNVLAEDLEEDKRE